MVYNDELYDFFMMQYNHAIIGDKNEFLNDLRLWSNKFFWVILGALLKNYSSAFILARVLIL